MESHANELLLQAVGAEAVGNFDLSLEFYQRSLQEYLEVYKTTPDGSDAKKRLLSIIESNMAEAERIKFLRDTRKAEPPTSSGASSKPAPQASSSSIFRFGAGKSKGTSKPPAVEPTSKGESSNSFLEANSGSGKLPDYHDYTRKRATAPNPASSASTPSSALKRKPPVPVRPGGEEKAQPQLAESKKPANEYATQILEEMLDASPGVHWDDIAGLSFAKQTLQEAVILPNLRPDLFTGLRRPPKGVLLFGPPGTGKTLLAKAVATESGFAFFSISASSVTSKYLGEGEKLMRALFETAREKQPAVIFFDEIDALMSSRKDNEHEASRRLKTEFMTQLDGATTSSEDRLLIMAATNLPWEIDEAVLRRLAKRIYIPLPDKDSRKALITHMLAKQGPKGAHITDSHLNRIVTATEGYSGSDLAAVCQEAALGPIREIDVTRLQSVKAEEVRPIREQDFTTALRVIRTSVSRDNLQNFQKWADQYGATR